MNTPLRSFRAGKETWDRLLTMAKEAHMSASAYLRALIENAWKNRQ